MALALAMIFALSAGVSRTARYALGFDELLAGDVEGMKRRSRNYARRQLTWMRKIPNLRIIDRTDLSDREVGLRIRDLLQPEGQP